MAAEFKSERFSAGPEVEQGDGSNVGNNTKEAVYSLGRKGRGHFRGSRHAALTILLGFLVVSATVYLMGRCGARLSQVLAGTRARSLATAQVQEESDESGSPYDSECSADEQSVSVPWGELTITTIDGVSVGHSKNMKGINKKKVKEPLYSFPRIEGVAQKRALGWVLEYLLGMNQFHLHRLAATVCFPMGDGALITVFFKEIRKNVGFPKRSVVTETGLQLEEMILSAFEETARTRPLPAVAERKTEIRQASKGNVQAAIELSVTATWEPLDSVRTVTGDERVGLRKDSKRRSVTRTDSTSSLPSFGNSGFAQMSLSLAMAQRAKSVGDLDPEDLASSQAGQSKLLFGGLEDDDKNVLMKLLGASMRMRKPSKETKANASIVVDGAQVTVGIERLLETSGFPSDSEVIELGQKIQKSIEEAVRKCKAKGTKGLSSAVAYNNINRGEEVEGEKKVTGQLAVSVTAVTYDGSPTPYQSPGLTKGVESESYSLSDTSASSWDQQTFEDDLGETGTLGGLPEVGSQEHLAEAETLGGLPEGSQEDLAETLRHLPEVGSQGHLAETVTLPDLADEPVSESVV